MRTIDISARAKSVNALLKQAQHTNLILRTADGFEFILAGIDDFNREIELTRKNKKLMAFLDNRARETKTISSADARIRLGLTAAVSPTVQKNSIAQTTALSRVNKQKTNGSNRRTH